MNKLKTTNIKGKEYVEVNERIRHFRECKDYEGWSLTSKIIEMQDKKVVIQATIKDKEGRTRATGLAYEMEGSSFINKTSYIENCETSAWGRALGNLGIGVDTSIASAEEVGNAIKQQKETRVTSADHVSKLKIKLNELGAKNQEEAENLIKEKTGKEVQLHGITQEFAQSLLIKLLENDK